MQRFYKYFTWMVLILVFAALSSKLVSSQSVVADDYRPRGGGGASAEGCRQHEVVVVESSQERVVHAAYDFARGTVSLVQIRRGFNPPEITTQARKLGQ